MSLEINFGKWTHTLVPRKKTLLQIGKKTLAALTLPEVA